MCLAEFAANYCTSHQCSDDTNDVVPDTIDSESTSSTITLLNGFGKMHKRKREAVEGLGDTIKRRSLAIIIMLT